MYKYCGPYWSAGRVQQSVDGLVVADNDLDECCKRHDAHYFYATKSSEYNEGDRDFVRCAGNQGFLGRAMSYAVSSNKLFRQNDPSPAGEKMTKNLRSNKTPAAKAAAQSGLTARKSNAPVSVGTVIRSKQPVLLRSKNGASLKGSDFVGTVECNGVADFGVGKSALLSPSYFVGTFLGNMVRSFEKYRWKRLRIVYVPKVSTATAGQVILTSSHSVSEPFLNPNSGTFLQRAMAQGNATMGPLWMENFIDIDCGPDFKLVDPATTSDPDDCIHEELQVFSQSSVSGPVGYLYADYEIEFSETIFTPHSTSMPIYTGPGLRVTLSDGAAVNVANDDVSLVDPSGLLNVAVMPNGSIYRAVFDISGSSPPTGATFGNYLNVATINRNTTATFAVVTSTLNMVGGLTLYLVIAGTVLIPYTSLEAAVAASGTGQLFTRTATTAVGTYAFDVALIRYGTTVNPTTQ